MQLYTVRDAKSRNLPEPVPESSSGGDSSLTEGLGLGAVTGGLGLAGGVGRGLGVGAGHDMQDKEDRQLYIHACLWLNPSSLLWPNTFFSFLGYILLCMCVCVYM